MDRSTTPTCMNDRSSVRSRSAPTEAEEHSLEPNPLVNDDCLRKIIRLHLSDDDDNHEDNHEDDAYDVPTLDVVNEQQQQDELESRCHASRGPNSWKEVLEVRDLKHRRVRFAAVDISNNHVVSSTSSGSGKIVSRLPWTDHEGLAGRYTGRVNADMRPHGSGALICKDGTTKTCVWKNGMPVKSWSPRSSEHAKKGKPSTSCSSSNVTYLPHLDIGDVGTPQDMILEESNPSTIDSLQIHDFAFILRSDGQWTYAIIADRQDNTIRFVVDTDGDTKTLSKKNWLTSIRLVNPDEACKFSKRSKKARNRKSSKQKEKKKDRKVQQQKKEKQRSI